jgi:hypothetical protein
MGVLAPAVAPVEAVLVVEAAREDLEGAREAEGEVAAQGTPGHR